MGRHLLLAALLLGSSTAACERGADAAYGGRDAPRTLVSAPAVLLHDPSGRLLARPDLASEDAAGRILITDYSDRDVKVYDGGGAPAGAVGRAGHGPGEFVALMMGQAYRDSVVAYDAVSARLSVFGPDRRLARALPLSGGARPAPFSIRVVDDSLFLLIGAVPGRQKRPLLSLVGPDGSTRSSFLDLAAYLGDDAQVASAIGLFADGADGRIFAAIAGGDSIWAFDYHGRRLGAFPADPAEPLRTVRSLVESNGGRIRRAGGGYVVDGVRRVVGLVALDSGTVAVQIAPYDGHLGVDPVEGGTLVVSALNDGGGRVIARQEITGAILGRDRRNRLLVLRYATPEAESYELMRMSLAPPPVPP